MVGSNEGSVDDCVDGRYDGRVVEVVDGRMVPFVGDADGSTVGFLVG